MVAALALAAVRDPRAGGAAGGVPALPVRRTRGHRIRHVHRRRRGDAAPRCGREGQGLSGVTGFLYLIVKHGGLDLMMWLV
jgi:hypothetical protein